MEKGLIRRDGWYSTRQIIPQDLQAHFGFKVKVTALGTAKHKEAAPLHLKKQLWWQEEFAKARAQLAAGTLKDKPPATDGPAQGASADRYATMSREQFEWEQENAEFTLRQVLEEEAEWQELEEAEARVLARFRDPKADLTDEERALRKLLEHHAWKANVADEHARIARSQAKQAARQATSEQAVSQPPRASTDAGMPLQTVVDRWATEQKPQQRTVKRTRNIVDRFEAVNGKLTVEAVTKQHVLAFRDALLADPKQTPANINVMIPMLGVVFNYAIHKLHLIQVNPAAKMQVSDKRRAKDKRRAFEEHELNAIFASPVYASDLRPVAGGGEAAYWLPLLSLFTGARQTELGQLHPEDVVQESYRGADGQEQSAWVVRIVENLQRGQRVKNEGSERRVPVHDELVSRGFLRMAAEARASGRARLFPDIRPNSVNELMGNWSKWFGRYRRKECGLVSKDTPFHSFRHTFKQYARLSDIPTSVHNEFTGHETGDVADTYGGLSYPLAPLVAGMAMYRVPGVKLPLPPPAYRE